MIKKTGRPSFCSPSKAVVRLLLTRRQSAKKERWYVAAPVKKGPQNCVVECVDSKGKVTYRDAIVVLPAKTPCSPPAVNQVVSAALVVSEYQHRNTIRQYRANKMFMRIVPDSVNCFPYRGAADASISKELKHAGDVLKKASIGADREDIIGSSIADASSYLQYWTPWVVTQDCVRLNLELRERWRAVHCWQKWIESGKDRVHYWKQVYRNTGKKLPNDPATALGDLMKLCKKMGLDKNKSFGSTDANR